MTSHKNKLLKIAEPWFTEVEVKAVGEVLASGQLIQGARVLEFERLFAAELGMEHAVMVSSGTAALHLVMLACGIGPGDAVAVPDFTFVATANAVALTGATPLLVDVEAQTYNMDIRALSELVDRMASSQHQGSLRLKMIMPVHQFGVPADMEPIAAIAEEYGLLLIEDAACALGSRYRSRGIGAWGAAACFSFHPRKVITTGEGGAVVTNDAKLAGRVRALRAHGFAAQPGPPALVAKGLNYRMTEMQAALGICQMQKLPKILRQRRILADSMHRHLDGVAWFKRPVAPLHLTPNWQSYVGVVGSGVDRDRVIARLNERGIEARPGATAIHLLEAYRLSSTAQVDSCPTATLLDAKSLALPLHPGMDEDDIRCVAKELRAYSPS